MTHHDNIDSTQSSTVTDPTTPDSTTIAFVCVQNAGRSQMATAYAERERDRRGWDDRIEILSGGTHPADDIHAVVVDVMNEQEIDLSDRTPREIGSAELASCDVIVTMGCSTLELADEAESSVDVRDWALDDPHGQPLETVRKIRSTVERRVRELFDELGDEIGDE